MSTIDSEEIELISRWKTGDEKAFNKLYELYKNRVYSFVLKLTKDVELSSDITQDTFIAAIKSIDQFIEGRSFLSWLFGIAHKKSIDYFRHKKVVHTNREKGEDAVGGALELPDSVLESKRFREALSIAIEELSVDQKEVFLMREMGGVSFNDISEIVDCSLSTALGRMRLALRRIRTVFEQRGIYGL